MLIGLARRITIVFTAVAFLGGATVQAMPPSGLVSAPAHYDAAMADCNAMAMPAAEQAPQPLPCKGMTADCLKAMGCIGFPNLPTPIGQVAEPIEYGRVDYPSADRLARGISVEPNLLPPIAA